MIKKDNFQNGHRITYLIVTLFLLVSLNLKSQVSFNLPKGYQTYKDYDQKEQRCDGDFDNDGITDLAIVCVDKNGGGKIIVVYLTTRYVVDKIYSWFPWDYNIAFKFSNNVLEIKSDDGFGFLEKTLILKYYANLKNMKLIGYGENNYVRSPNSGGGMIKVKSKTINLSTGEYEVNGGVKKKITIDLITLSNIEKYFDYLSLVGENDK